MKASYTPTPIPAFKGNPLIEALPPIRCDEEWIKCFNTVPYIEPAIRKLPSELRILSLVDLERFNYPLAEYLDLSRRIESALYRGYSTKNPLLPTATHFLHYLDPEETPVQPSSGCFEPMPTGITLVGPSGAGKTRMIDRILGEYDQVIHHESYHGRELPLTQVIWLKIDCPEDQSLVTFAMHFLSALDDALGTDYFGESVKARNNKGVMRQRVIRLARAYRVGFIVLDEFSNLKLPRRAKADNVPPLLKLILNLMNGSGVPFLFSGNPEMLDVLKLTLKTARRAENGGVIEMDPLYPEEWLTLSKRLWSLQVTNHVSPWTEEAARHLYEASRGLVEIAVRGFFEAQRLVIGSGDERLTDTVIEMGAARAIQLSNEMLDVSVTENIVDGRWEASNAAAETRNSSKKIEASSGQTQTPEIKLARHGLNDPYRTNHLEFEGAIDRLRKSGTMLTRDSHPDLLREAVDDNTLIQSLIDQDVILEDLYSPGFGLSTKG